MAVPPAWVAKQVFCADGLKGRLIQDPGSRLLLGTCHISSAKEGTRFKGPRVSSVWFGALGCQKTLCTLVIGVFPLLKHERGTMGRQGGREEERKMEGRAKGKLKKSDVCILHNISVE